MGKIKNKPKNIAVLIESHYDPTEPGAFKMFFSANDYEVKFVTILEKGEKEKMFRDNDRREKLFVSEPFGEETLNNSRGLLLVGGYAMDMLRYRVFVGKEDNIPKASQILALAIDMMDEGELVIGTICHSLWLFTPLKEKLENRERKLRVTCSHNIMHDVQNAGLELVYDEERRMLVDTYVDGNLVTARHPYVVQAFMNEFLSKLE